MRSQDQRQSQRQSQRDPKPDGSGSRVYTVKRRVTAQPPSETSGLGVLQLSLRTNRDITELAGRGFYVIEPPSVVPTSPPERYAPTMAVCAVVSGRSGACEAFLVSLSAVISGGGGGRIASDLCSPAGFLVASSPPAQAYRQKSVAFFFERGHIHKLAAKAGESGPTFWFRPAFTLPPLGTSAAGNCTPRVTMRELPTTVSPSRRTHSWYAELTTRAVYPLGTLEIVGAYNALATVSMAGAVAEIADLVCVSTQMTAADWGVSRDVLSFVKLFNPREQQASFGDLVCSSLTAISRRVARWNHCSSFEFRPNPNPAHEAPWTQLWLRLRNTETAKQAAGCQFRVTAAVTAATLLAVFSMVRLHGAPLAKPSETTWQLLSDSLRGLTAFLPAGSCKKRIGRAWNPADHGGVTFAQCVMREIRERE